ncbi:MAG: class I SAM-dependent methyltransferase [Nocardioidaceae bacterium]
MMMGSRTASDRPRPLFARYYAAMTARMDDEGLAALRDELLTGVGGQVVEVGCGNGMNFSRYPSTVTKVRAVEPEPHLRKLAQTAAAHAPVPVDVTPGIGQALPLPDDSVDTGVLCLVLCSMPDPRATVAELARVIRPGGALVFLEHCAAHSPGLRLAQRIADATLWPLLTGGCHTSRDPLTTIRDGGFTVDTVRHLRYPERPTVPASPHVLGHASRP